VKFSKNSQELGLPASAELFLDFHGRRIHRRQSFRDYLLFSVDDTQKISVPESRARIEAEQLITVNPVRNGSEFRPRPIHLADGSPPQRVPGSFTSVFIR